MWEGGDHIYSQREFKSWQLDARGRSGTGDEEKVKRRGKDEVIMRRGGGEKKEGRGVSTRILELAIKCEEEEEEEIIIILYENFGVDRYMLGREWGEEASERRRKWRGGDALGCDATFPWSRVFTYPPRWKWTLHRSSKVKRSP